MKRTIIIALLCAACDQGTQSELSSAYEEAVVQTRSSQTVGDTMAFRQQGAPMDPLMLAADLEAFIASESDCATIIQDGNIVTVDFGEDGCAYLDRTLTGSLSADISEGDNTTIVALELYDLGDGIVTLNGSADASLTDTERSFNTDFHISHSADTDPACDRSEGEEGAPDGEQSAEGPPEGPPRPPAEVDMVGSRTETPLDGSFDVGIIVNGSRQMSADEGDASMTETGIEIVAGELVPQAGTIVHDSPRGAVTMTFSRVDDNTIEINIEGERGSESFQVDSTSGERL